MVEGSTQRGPFLGAGTGVGVEVWRVKKRKLVKGVIGEDELLEDGVVRCDDCVVALRSVEEMRLGRAEKKWIVVTWTGSGAGMSASGLAGSMASKLARQLEAVASSTRVSRLDCSTAGELGAALGMAVEARGGSFFVAEKEPAAAAAADVVKAYRLGSGMMLRRCCPSGGSVEATAALVVVAPGGGGEVLSWAGRKCGRVQRAVAEEAARRMAAALEVEARVVDDERIVRDLLRGGGEEAREDEDVAIWEWVEEGWRRLETDANGDGICGGRRAAVETLRRDGTFYVDATTERWVWRGRFSRVVAAAPPDDGKKKKKRPSYVEEEAVEVVRDRFEPVPFRELFYGWDDDRLEVGAYHETKSSLARGPRRGIEAEASRMVQRGIGSLEAAGDESDAWLAGDATVPRAGDDARASLALDLADESELDIYRLEGDALVRRPSLRRWMSSDVVVCVLRCKNDSLRIAYAWEGDDATIKARAAAGLGLRHLGGEHELHARQNAEPPLLVAAAARHFGGPPIILKEARSVSRGYARGTVDAETYKPLCVKVAAPPGLDCLDDRLIRAVQEPLTTARTFYDEAACYLIVEDATTSCRVVVGKAARETVVSIARAVAAILGSRVVEDTEPLVARAVAPREPPRRMARLFEVSRARREVGGVFAVDLGRTFGQADLGARGTYVLDTGDRPNLFVWLGAAVLPEEAKLAIAVAVAYARAMEGADSHGSVVDVERVARDRGLRRVERAREVSRFVEKTTSPRAYEVRLVLMGREPPEFAGAFFGWRKFDALRNEDWSARFLRRVEATAAPLETCLLSSSSSSSSSNEKGESPAPPPKAEAKRKRRTTVATATSRILTVDERLGARATRDGALLKLEDFAVEEPLDSVLADLRAGLADFAVFSYRGKDRLKLDVSARGDLSDLRAALLLAGTAAYGLLAVDDDSSPFRLCLLVTYIPDTVPPLFRGLLNARRAITRAIFEPIHVDLTCSGDLDALTDSALASELDTLHRRTSF